MILTLVLASANSLLVFVRSQFGQVFIGYVPFIIHNFSPTILNVLNFVSQTDLKPSSLSQQLELFFISYAFLVLVRSLRELTYLRVKKVQNSTNRKEYKLSPLITFLVYISRRLTELLDIE